jgi:hypothetical protein
MYKRYCASSSVSVFNATAINTPREERQCERSLRFVVDGHCAAFLVSLRGCCVWCRKIRSTAKILASFAMDNARMEVRDENLRVLRIVTTNVERASVDVELGAGSKPGFIPLPHKSKTTMICRLIQDVALRFKQDGSNKRHLE